MESCDELTAKAKLWIPDFVTAHLRFLRLPADMVSRLPGTWGNSSDLTGEVTGRFRQACHCQGIESPLLVVGREKGVATDGPALVLREEVARAESLAGSGSA